MIGWRIELGTSGLQHQYHKNTRRRCIRKCKQLIFLPWLNVDYVLIQDHLSRLILIGNTFSSSTRQGWRRVSDRYQWQHHSHKVWQDLQYSLDKRFSPRFLQMYGFGWEHICSYHSPFLINTQFVLLPWLMSVALKIEKLNGVPSLHWNSSSFFLSLSPIQTLTFSSRRKVAFMKLFSALLVIDTRSDFKSRHSCLAPSQVTSTWEAL